MADLRERLAGARLYLCTGARRREGDLAEFLDTVLAAGVDIVQLREKGLEAREEIALAEVFADAAARHGRLFSLNDRADIAAVARPDILHLGQDDLPVSAARDILGDEILIGRSTHAESEVSAAAVEVGSDYYCVGPTWPTPTKPGRHAPGLQLTSYAVRQAADRPWFAIGGIDLTNIEQVVAAGATRVVVVRAITEADDPAEATRALLTALPTRPA